MYQRLPRGRDRSREPRRSRTRSPPRRLALLPNEDAAVACTRANLQLLFTSFKDMMKLVEVERFLLAHHRRRGRTEDSPLTVVRGLLVRYNYDGYRLGLVAQYLVEDGEDKVAVQASLQGEESALSCRILLECLSSKNSLEGSGWEEQGERELAGLAAHMLHHPRPLPLGQVAGAACRRQAALRWHAQYRGEPDMAAHLHRLIADLEDRAELQRTAAQFNLLPQSVEPAQQQRQQQQSPRWQQRESPRRLSRGSRSRSPQRQRREGPEQQQRQQQQLVQGHQGQGSPPQRLRREGSQHQLLESPPPQRPPRELPPRQQHQQQQADEPRPAGQVHAGEQLAPAAADASGASQLPPHLVAQAPQQGSASAMPVVPVPSAAHIVPSFILLGGSSSAAETDAGTHRVAQPAQPPSSSPGAAAAGCSEVLAARQAAVAAMATAKPGQSPAAASCGGKAGEEPLQAAAADTGRAAAAGQPRAAANEAAAPAPAGSKRKRAPLQWQAQEPQPGDAPLLLPDKNPAAQQQAAAAAAEPKAKDKKQRVAAAGGAGVTPNSNDFKQTSSAAAAAGKFQITVRNLPPEGEHGLAGDDAAARHGKGASSSRQAAAAAGAAASSQPQASRRERRDAAAAAAAADHRPSRQVAPTQHGNAMPPVFDGGSTRRQASLGPPPSYTERGGSGGREAQYAPARSGSGDGSGWLTVRVRLPPAAVADDGGDDYGAYRQHQSAHQHQQPAHQAAAAAPPSTLAGRFDGLTAQLGQRTNTPPPVAAAAAAPSAAAAAAGNAHAALTAAAGAPGVAHLGYAPQHQQQQQQSVFPAAALAAVAQMYGQAFDPTVAAGQLAYLQQLQQTPPLNVGLPVYPQQHPEQQQQQQQQLVMPAQPEYAAAAPTMPGVGSLQAAPGYGSGSLARQTGQGGAEALVHLEDEQAGRRHVSRPRSAGDGGSREENGRMVEFERHDRSRDRGRGGEAGNGRVVEAGGRGRTAEVEGSKGGSRGDRSGGGFGSESRSLFWDPMWQWESDVVQLLQSRASGVWLTELQDSHPLPPCWAQTPEAFYAYLSIRKQLFTVHHSQKGGRENILIAPAKGARPFLIFKRRLLQFLADRRPRTSVQAVQHAAPPTGHLMPALQREAETDFVAFVSKYLRDEVGVVRSIGPGRSGNGGDRDGVRGSGERFLLELRPFPRGAGGRDAPSLHPPFGAACKGWQSKSGCKFGDTCYNTHAPQRSFTDRTSSQRR